MGWVSGLGWGRVEHWVGVRPWAGVGWCPGVGCGGEVQYINLAIDALHTKPKIFDMLECFCGAAEYTKAGLRAGMVCKGYDKKYDAGHDITKASGLRNHMLTLRFMKRNSYTRMAPGCSPWIFLCRKQSKRSQSSPLGDTSLPWFLAGSDSWLQ